MAASGVVKGMMLSPMNLTVVTTVEKVEMVVSPVTCQVSEMSEMLNTC